MLSSFLTMCFAAALMAVLIRYYVVQDHRERRFQEQQFKLVTGDDTLVLKAAIASKTGRTFRDLYWSDFHWYVMVEGAYVKVEDLLRAPRHNAEADAHDMRMLRQERIRLLYESN